MRESLLSLLCCPRCRAALSLKNAGREVRGHIESGDLVCVGCAASFPIVEGVPDFVVERGAASVENTTSGFAYNWQRFNKDILSEPALNDELFRDWIAPLQPEWMKGRVVVEAGCGMGRWLLVAQSYGPRDLIGFDYSMVAHTAYGNTRHLPNVHVVRADLFHPPLVPVDVIYSLGVVHHTPDPAGGFHSLVRLMKPDGAMSVWVYGQENNAWIENVVSPLREAVTSRMPTPLLMATSKVLSWQLVALARAYTRAVPQPSSRFAYDAYLRYLRKYPPRYLEHIVYDHLVPQLASYHSKDELEQWATQARLAFTLTSRNDNSWRLVAAHTPDVLRAASTPS